MNKPVWTESQKEAIDFSGNNLLVSAAAGSGKTAVMIERIFSLISRKKTSADRILVVTYTNAAAASMRAKLIARFDSELKENPDNEYLYRQKQLLDRANISTMHAFCQNLLRRYYFYTPLSPDFRILDDTQKSIFSEKAINEILEEAATKYENGLFDEYGDALDQFASKKNDDGLKNAVLALNNYLSVMAEPEKFEIINRDLYSGKDKWKDALLKQIKEKCFLALEYADEVRKHYAFEANGEKILKDADAFSDEFERIACENSFEKISEILSCNAPAFRAGKDEITSEYAKARGVLKQTRATIKSLTKNIEDINDSSVCAVRALFYLERSYALRFDDLCFSEGGVTFNSLLRIALDLIKSNEEIRNELKDNTDYIFVDEYQDINELQNGIVENISRGDNLFFVGDVKQSIYSFQLASPELFLGKMRDYSTDVLGSRINLKNNFRSSSRILNAVNTVFKKCMYEDVTEIEYDEDAELRPSFDESSPQNNHILFNNGEIENEAEILFTDTNEMSEEEAVAKRILSLMNCSVLDPATGNKRMLTYGDVMILGRNNGFGAKLESAFKRYGIPFKAGEKKTKESFDALGSVISLLHLLEVRRSDSDLIIVLLSAIGKFTYEELGIIRKEKKDGSFFDAFVSFDKDIQLKSKIDAFLDELDRLDLLQASMCLPDFITYVYNSTGFVYSVAVTEDSFIQEENMNILISAARTYSENYSGGLRGFLKYYESIKFTDSPAAQINENDNAVHYMTMHKSKGLEFPVVILYNLGAAKSGSEKEILKFSKKLGIAFKAQKKDEFGYRTSYDPVSTKAVSLENKRADSAEKLRLLYVAMTRAKNKLIVSIAGKREPASKTSSSLKDLIALPSKLAASSFESYTSLLMPIIYFSHDSEQLKEWLTDGSVSGFAPENSVWALVFSKKGKDVQTEAAKMQEEAFDKEEYLSKIEAALSWQYPYISATGMRAKQNPSKSAEHTRMMLRSPKFGDKEYKGAQKGTIVHFFMEHFSFTSSLSARKQAENMLATGLISNDEFASLPFEHLESFVSGDFAKRMRNAPVIYRERPFCKIIPLEDTGDEALMQGTVDCYFFEGDNIILLDYKTDIIHGSIETYIAHHRRQLSLYADALSKLYPGKTVLPYIHFFSVDKTVEI